MHLRDLRLKGFRNISDQTFGFHPRFNVLVGPNAQGKTNVIESVYFLAFGRSFRVSDFRDMIGFGGEGASIKAWISHGLGEEEREALLGAGKKRFFKNGKGTAPNQFQSMPVVLFAPEEIRLFKESPQARRDYIDGLISKLSPTYGDNLGKYKRALSQRNKVLKEEIPSLEKKREQIVLWEGPLVDHGMGLIEERKIWTDRLNGVLKERYGLFGEKVKEARFQYEPNVEAADFAGRQEARREEELERGTSLVGPHRDDFLASLNGGPLRTFGSQGEMRSFTLALKLSEMTLFETVLGQSPILLLDDVLSELDENRCRLFFSFLESFQGQIFTTATALSLFPPSVLNDFKVWQMDQGRAKLI